MQTTQSPKAGERTRKTEQGIYCGEHRKTCCPECGACPADPQQHHSYCSQLKKRDSATDALSRIFKDVSSRGETNLGADCVRIREVLAVAPELLATLSEVLSSFETALDSLNYTTRERNRDPQIVKARAVITKAEGTRI